MKIKKWEAAMAAALVACVAYTAVCCVSQQRLADKMIRLHVIANSDSEFDQTVKYRVRDAVLSELGSGAEKYAGREDALRDIESRLPELECAALETVRACGADSAVHAELGIETYPTREYETFTLPAGEYESLRIVIGDGNGKNWWCVIYTELCTTAVVDWDEETELTKAETKLITDTGTYALRFRVLEIVSRIKKAFNIR